MRKSQLRKGKASGSGVRTRPAADRAPPGEPASLVQGRELVLPRGRRGVDPACLDHDLARQPFDGIAVQLHVAQRHEQAGPRALAPRSREQSPVHGHGLRPVLAQVDGVQPPVAPQRIARTAVRGRGCGHAALVPGHDALEQAHRAGVRQEVGDVRLGGQVRGAPGGRVISRASTKLLTTPAATVMPMALSTGSVENA